MNRHAFSPLTVVGRSPLADDAIRLSLQVPADLRSSFVGEAGQHVTVRAQLAGKSVRRTYSVVDYSRDGVVTLGVRVHANGLMSTHLACAVVVGDVIEVMPPRGGFVAKTADEVPRRYVMFASGSGITPLLAIIGRVLERNPESTVILFYGNRSVTRTMFIDELLALKDRFISRLTVHFIMSAEPQNVDEFNGRLDAARIKAFAGRLFWWDRADEYFVCGPSTMIDEVKGVLWSHGVSPEAVHHERFGLAPSGTQRIDGSSAGRKHGSQDGVSVVNVVLDGRRRTFPMTSQHASILEAAEQAGVALPYSCCAGVCSTCRARVVDGGVRMVSNMSLEDWEIEVGYVLVCQAQPTTGEVSLTYDER